MTDEQFDQLKQVIYVANNHPVQAMKCLICDYCDIYIRHNRCAFIADTTNTT